ncbi:MAG TPA: alpha/beta hydrolase [Sphingomicrobium sp.]|nr:alpha/beta hydrolase [Sphingomicrobium sp.]
MIKTADGAQIRVIQAGKQGASPPLVLIPGWSTSADIWSRQIHVFAKDRRVISFDPRSQGESTKVVAGNTPETRAQDLHALLASLGAQRPVLVGWSQGVQDLAAYVEQYGTKDLAGIVLVDAPVSDGAAGIAASPQAAAAQFKMLGIYAAHQQDYLRGMFGAIISKPQPAGLVDGLVATGMKTPPSTGVAMLVADLFGTDRTGAIAKIDCPTLVIAAASSPELAVQQAMAKRIRGARFESVDDAAHAVFLDQPERFDALLGGFLAGLSDWQGSR